MEKHSGHLPAQQQPTTPSPTPRRLTPLPERSYSLPRPMLPRTLSSPSGPRRAIVRVPKPVLRVVFGAVAITIALVLWTGVASGVDDGTWDASTAVERGRPGQRNWLVALLVGSRDTGVIEWTDAAKDAAPFAAALRTNAAPRPNLSRLHDNSTTRDNKNHRGYSRIPISGTDEYVLAPLPSLEEAYARLVPKLNKLQADNPVIPAEHNLGSGIFPGFLNDELKQRYAHLREEWDEDRHEWVPGGEKRYLFVTICRQVAGMLGDWFAAWTVLADFLGPETLVFSLMEGSSDDGSGILLSHAMRDHLLFIGVPPGNIFIKTELPTVDWSQHHRIEMLAEMRNAAMQPIFGSSTPHLSPDGKPWSAIIWYNDVYLGAAHFLEELHQHFWQDADMTCGWDHAGKWFYDGWVGRDMSGDLFTPFPVPQDEQDNPQKLFLSSPATRERHERNLPYQVFSCWNGIAVMSPTPFLPPYNVRFRRGTPRLPDQAKGTEECQASESQFISWDFWKYGFGRIQTVPGVHLTYGKDDAKTRGFVDFPRPDRPHPEKIRWHDRPPKQVRCHDWPDKLGKSFWAWDSTRWVPSPKLVIPKGQQ